MSDSDQTRAVTVRAGASRQLVIEQAKLAPALPHELTVRVTAISLNRGEVKRALTIANDGWRPGWDFAGIVEESPKLGGGPPPGSRVVGVREQGAWAERIRVSPQAVAVLPDAVTDAQAATLPVAGLTALYALRKGGLLLGRKVLVDGASGGVGHLAVQLARASGALVYGHVRQDASRAVIAESCNGGVIVGPTLESARRSGPYHLILDSVGGATLASALTMLERTGACVTFGVSEAPSVTFESGAFFRAGGVSLHGLILFDEIVRVEPATLGLSILADLVARKVLTPRIEIEAPWTQISEIAQQLIDRKYPGKAVLHVA